MQPVPAALLMLLGGAAAAYVWAVNGLPPMIDSVLNSIYATGGGAVYLGAFLLLLATPLRAGLIAIFVPLGRTALTNYITATLLLLSLVGLNTVLGVAARDTTSGWTWAMASCGAVLVLQWMASAAWLRYFQQGPLEWVWRKVAWLGERDLPLLRRRA